MDDPWKEHAKWNPKCHFLLMVKGSGFVENVQKTITDGDHVDMLMKQEPAQVIFLNIEFFQFSKNSMN